MGLTPPINNDVFLAIVRNQHSGFRKVDVIGRYLNASRTTSDIWLVGGTLTWLTAPSTMSIVSDNTGDTAAGAGARTVHIYGLDSTFAEINEIVTLNGLTPVTTVNSYIRINYMEIATVGTYTGSNLGNITITSTTGNYIQGRIGIYDSTGLGLLQKSHYTIPKGYNGYILSWNCNVDSNKTATFSLRSRHGANIVVAPFSYSHLIDSFDANQYTQDLKGSLAMMMPEYTDIWFTVKAPSSGTMVRTRMELLLIPKTLETM